MSANEPPRRFVIAGVCVAAPATISIFAEEYSPTATVQWARLSQLSDVAYQSAFRSGECRREASSAAGAVRYVTGNGVALAAASEAERD
jgi:hypothetical protein